MELNQPSANITNNVVNITNTSKFIHGDNGTQQHHLSTSLSTTCTILSFKTNTGSSKHNSLFPIFDYHLHPHSKPVDVDLVSMTTYNILTSLDATTMVLTTTHTTLHDDRSNHNYVEQSTNISTSRTNSTTNYNVSG